MRGHEGVVDLVQRAEEIVLNIVVVGELLAGFRRGKRLRENQEALERFRVSPRVETVGLDGETADRYAEIVAHLRQVGTPIPTNDVWIAASAMQHGLRVVTTGAHFERVPQVATEVLVV